MDLNLEVLEALIKRSDFEGLVGKYENVYFDGKSQIYDLRDNKQKYELAKDVSAFANAHGGFILIGVKTSKCEESMSDKITEIRYVKKDLCNSREYVDNIQAWIYPRLDGLSANWYASKADHERGVFVIAIPPQDESKKPFLTTTSLEGSKKRNSVFFGYSERMQENNNPHSITSIHQLLRNGLNFQTNIDNRLQSIESLLQQQTSAPQILPLEEAFDLSNRTQKALAAAEMTDKRVMLMFGYPNSPDNIRLLLSSKADGPRSLLAAPPQIRERGFGTRVIDRPTINGGNLIRVKGRDIKVIDLYKDGLLLAAFRADEEFLCWGMNRNLFNPVALVETIVTFVMLYGQVLGFLSEKPQEINFRVSMRNLHLNGIKNILAEGDLENVKTAFEDEMRYAPEDNWVESLSLRTDEFEEQKVAYSLVEIVYNHFGIDTDFIPYKRELAEGEKIVDTERITAI